MHGRERIVKLVLAVAIAACSGDDSTDTGAEGSSGSSAGSSDSSSDSSSSSSGASESGSSSSGSSDTGTQACGAQSCGADMVCVHPCCSPDPCEAAEPYCASLGDILCDGMPVVTDHCSVDDCEGTLAGYELTCVCGSAIVPGEVLDLAEWKLTLPVADRRGRDAPREILQPELATFAIDPWFMLVPTGDAVQFRANAGGVTTDNSGYPRSELREMSNGGTDEASWSTNDGTHTMTIVQAITALPEAKPHVVAGQIHDAEDDVVMIRLEGEHLFVEGGGEELGDLEPAYALGTVFTVVLAAHDGMIEIYYEDLAAPAVSLARDVDGCYFKAGAYTQSNEEQGDVSDAYGEVVISDLVLVHE